MTITLHKVTVVYICVSPTDLLLTFYRRQNPPLPPGVVDSRVMHTLRTSINGDFSSGTGPSHEIAKANHYFPLRPPFYPSKIRAVGLNGRREKGLQFGVALFTWFCLHLFSLYEVRKSGESLIE
jgi:hypothetical protein